MRIFVFYFLSTLVVSVVGWSRENVLFEQRELAQRQINLRRELVNAVLIARQIWLEEDDDSEQFFYARSEGLKAIGSGHLKPEDSNYWLHAPAPDPSKDAVMQRPGKSYSVSRKLKEDVSDEKFNTKTRQLAKVVEGKYKNTDPEGKALYQQVHKANGKSPAVYRPMPNSDGVEKGLPMSTGQVTGKGKNRKYEFQSQGRPINQPDHGKKGQNRLDKSTDKQAVALGGSDSSEEYAKLKKKVGKKQYNANKHELAALKGIKNVPQEVLKKEQQGLHQAKADYNEKAGKGAHGNSQKCPECQLISHATNDGRSVRGGRQVAYGTRPGKGKKTWGPQDPCDGNSAGAHGCEHVQKDNGMRATTDKAREQEANRRSKNKGNTGKHQKTPPKNSKDKDPSSTGTNGRDRSKSPTGRNKSPKAQARKDAQEKKSGNQRAYQQEKQKKRLDKNSQKEKGQQVQKSVQPKKDPKKNQDKQRARETARYNLKDDQANFKAAKANQDRLAKAKQDRLAGKKPKTPTSKPKQAELPPNKLTPKQRKEKNARVDTARQQLKAEVAKNKAADKAKNREAHSKDADKKDSKSAGKQSSFAPSPNRFAALEGKDGNEKKAAQKQPEAKKQPNYMAGIQSSAAKQKPKVGGSSSAPVKQAPAKQSTPKTGAQPKSAAGSSSGSKKKTK